MATRPSEPQQAVAEARPVDPSERVLFIDVLRGFGLCGIFVANALEFFSGRSLLPREQLEALNASPVNTIAQHLFYLLVSGKAMALFSFLFGLGFAIQLERAQEREASIVPVYARRMGVLLLIGLAHLFLLWYGDILTLYACTGLALLLWRKQSDSRLVRWGLVLMLGGPLVFHAVLRLLPLLTGSQEATQAAAREALAALRSRTLEAFGGSSYVAAMRANAEFYLGQWLRPAFIMFALVTLGRFLLGFAAGRQRLLHEVERHRPLLRRLLWWGLAAAVVGHGGGHAIQALSGLLKLPRGTPWLFFMPVLWELGVLGVATVYLAGLSLLFERPGWRRGLSVLAPAGKMALTNYLSQSALGLLVFHGYGLGLIGKLSAAVCMALIFGLFWVQVLVSHLWLARFRFGPVEWLWRSLTYGKPQPMRREPVRAEQGEAAA